MKKKKTTTIIYHERIEQSREEQNRTEQSRHFVSLTIRDTEIRKKKMMGTLVMVFNLNQSPN
jgi:hypothetical protein